MAAPAWARHGLRLCLGAGGAAGGVLCWDYSTMNKMRSFHGWRAEDCALRCRNTFLAPSRGFSLDELGRYNGREAPEVYFAVRSAVGATRVYDATASEMFRDSYGGFCGKDATVALARMSLDPALVNSEAWRRGLSADEAKSLDSWVEYFDQKYVIVGHLRD